MEPEAQNWLGVCIFLKLWAEWLCEREIIRRKGEDSKNFTAWDQVFWGWVRMEGYGRVATKTFHHWLQIRFVVKIYRRSSVLRWTNQTKAIKAVQHDGCFQGFPRIRRKMRLITASPVSKSFCWTILIATVPLSSPNSIHTSLSA